MNKKNTTYLNIMMATSKGSDPMMSKSGLKSKIRFSLLNMPLILAAHKIDKIAFIFENDYEYVITSKSESTMIRRLLWRSLYTTCTLAIAKGTFC